jgi:uncharacterized protein with PQ loop repeat
MSNDNVVETKKKFDGNLIFQKIIHSQDKYNDKWKIVFAWTMVFVAIFESSFLFMQAAKGFNTKSSNDLDLTAFIIVLVTNLMWFVYGTFVLKDVSIAISGLLYSIGAILVIIVIFIY